MLATSFVRLLVKNTNKGVACKTCGMDLLSILQRNN